MFQIQNTNNNRLSAVNAMPLKDLTSDGESSFSQIRREYKTTTDVVSPEKNKAVYGNSTNRSASSVIKRNKTIEAGKGVNNKSGVFGFTNGNDYNAVGRSLVRVRRMGGAVPPKCNS